MLARPIRKAIAVAFACLILAGCTGERAPAAAAEDGSPPASVVASASEPEDDAAAIGTDLDELCGEDDIACHESFYQLEETLFLYEGGIANRLDAPARACWQADGEAFRRTLAACGDNACRERALGERIAGLHYLQPLEHRAGLDLPEAPELIAVIGPEHEAEAAPDAPPPVPFEAHGRLIHATAHGEHMGIAVQSAGGDDHVFIFDMDIDSQPGHNEVLGLVGASPTAKVLVRGYRKVAPDGIANFDTAGCRVVYLLP